MANWYCSREDIIRTARIKGVAQHPVIDRIIESVARDQDRWTRRFFIPRTQTRLYRWPQLPSAGRSWVLWLDQDLLSVSALKTKAQDTTPTTISASDFFLEPANRDRYNRIEIDQSSTATFEAGNTPQRSISVAGSWGYSGNTRSVGTVTSGLSSSASATSFVCSDASLIDVGDTLLIESEQLFVSDRSNAANGSDLLDGALTADLSDVGITVDDGGLYSAGEEILVDSERMLVESISGNVLTVTRAYDGSILASHTNNTAVHVFRTLTVERGVNGTTAATHANSTAISKYEPEYDIREWAIAETLARYYQGGAGWGREIGVGDGAKEFTGADLGAMRSGKVKHYKKRREATI